MSEETESNSFFVTDEESEKRIDQLLADRFPNYSRTYFQSLIERHLVLLNGNIVKKREKPKPLDEIEVEFALTPEISLEAENIPLDILYEDDSLLAINKKAGMVVHPGAGNFAHTFVNALLYHCKHLEKGESLRPGIVHRLDKETSGVLLAAKTSQVQEKLVAQFAGREVHKEYLAVCVGNPGARVIVGNIGRDPYNRKKMALVEKGGKASETEVKSLFFDGTYAFVRLFPKTGRTHQLRVHLKSVGTPILGDPLYGSEQSNRKEQIFRQLLHAERLIFTHPVTHKKIEVVAPLPSDMERWKR